MAFAGYFSFLQRRWPLSTDREALQVGAAWAAMTTAFEFTFGRLVAKQSWSELLGSYNVFKGRLWPLMHCWIAVGPTTVRRVLGPAVGAELRQSKQ